MHLESLRRGLESLDQARSLLEGWTVRDVERGWRNLRALGETLGLDSLRELTGPLGRLLPRCPDADMALNNLERFLAHSGGAQLLPQLVEGRSRTLEVVLQLFSTSQFFSDLLVTHSDYLDMLRVPLRRSPSPHELDTQLRQEVESSHDDASVLRAFRRFRHRQYLRIGTNDIIRDRPFEEITRDLSRVADAALEVALQTALRTLGNRFGEPMTAGGEPAQCVILAFGKLGGEELNYSSDIDLLFLYDEEGYTHGRRSGSVSNDEFFARVASEVIRLLSAHTDQGQGYRVDLRLRPEGQRGPLARSLASTLSYYDTLGRTWERQALIKLRPVAGHLPLGQRFLQAVESFVYRQYLTFAEINEIKAMKRRIEQKTARAGTSDTEVKTGRGGIRDIEFTIQFLQLLNGGDLNEVRQRNTLLAMQALEGVGCLTDQEYHLLDDAYRFLRKTEHRLQLLFDLQTHRLPETEEELRKLALRMGYTDPSKRGRGERKRSGAEPALVLTDGKLPQQRSALDDVPPRFPDTESLFIEPLDAFLHDYHGKTEPARRILDHLLHQTFQGEAGEVEPEVDLMLDPDPDAATIQAVLGRYPFHDIPGAYHNLNQLAQESVRFLSTRRCRHFLASIAPQLLRVLAEAPDPDMALRNLEKVTASLGGKAILWELFSFNPPSLKLYVELCAWSQFLSEILINNPGMIDELLDSLVLNQPRTIDELQLELRELCRGADDPEPILHSFQDKELLRIGVRDMLDKVTIEQTTAALSDLAETILAQIAVLQYTPLVRRYGTPLLDAGPRSGAVCRYALLGLGKLGGRELSYHSDLDLVLVYEGEGRTGVAPGSVPGERPESIDDFEFFTELAQRIIRATSQIGPMGRLYQIDMRLRPTGKSGNLVLPLAEFQRYYESGSAQLWERQTLTRARIVHGDADFGRDVLAVARQAAYERPWKPEDLDEILAMRERLEASRGGRDLKRGFGGLVDVEFLVQSFQLEHGSREPSLRATNVWQALEELHRVGLLDAADYRTLRGGYDFLLRVQSRLRIVHNRSLDEVPESQDELAKLARRLGFEGGDPTSAAAAFLAELERHTTRLRELFLRSLARR
jgi:glutamate-ammonia-ligase adenylyltransferase